MSIIERLESRAARKHCGPALPSPAVRLAIRAAAGATQEDIAAELGVNRASVAKYETGTREPRGELRERYLAVLHDLQRLTLAPTSTS